MAFLDALRIHTTVAISKDERAFFAQMGARVAELHKAQNIPQVQLAERLRISRQTINADHNRAPVDSGVNAPAARRDPGMSIKELLGTAQPAKKHGPVSKLRQQRFVMQMLDTVLAQADR